MSKIYVNGVPLDRPIAVYGYDLCNAPDEAIMENLLANGANPNAVKEMGKTPLCFADTVDKVRLLLKSGADPRGTRLSTPLHWARSREIAKMLLDAGAPVDKRDHFGRTPLMTADNQLIARLLLERGADADARDILGMSALHNAATADTVRLLISAGAEVNALSKDKRTPIETVSDKGAITALFESGGRIHPKRTCELLHRAHDLETIKDYLAAGVSVKMLDSRKRTALFPHLHDSEIFRFLIDNGVDINARDGLGRTVVFYIRTLAELETLRLCGADLAVCDKKGVDLYHFFNDDSIRGYLMEHRIVTSFQATEEPSEKAAPPAIPAIPPDLKDVIATGDAEYFVTMLDIYAAEEDMINVFHYLYQNDRNLCRAFLERGTIPAAARLKIARVVADMPDEIEFKNILNIEP